MTTDDRRLKDARRDAIPADPPSPLTLRAAAAEIAYWKTMYETALASIDRLASSPAPAGLNGHRLMRAIEAAVGSDTIGGWGVGPLSDAIEREYEEGARE